MTPQHGQGHQGLMKQRGWRGDGRQVPGNQQGGANGRYGRYGQDPDAAIPDHEENDISQAAASGLDSAQGDPQGNAETIAGRPTGEADYHAQAGQRLLNQAQPQDGGNELGGPSHGDQQQGIQQQGIQQQNNSIQALPQSPQSNAQMAAGRPTGEAAYHAAVASVPSRYRQPAQNGPQQQGAAQQGMGSVQSQGQGDPWGAPTMASPQNNSIQALPQSPQSNAQTMAGRPTGEADYHAAVASVPSRYRGAPQQSPQQSPQSQGQGMGSIQSQGQGSAWGAPQQGAAQQGMGSVQSQQGMGSIQSQQGQGDGWRASQQGRAMSQSGQQPAPAATPTPTQSGGGLATPFGQMMTGGGAQKMADGGIVSEPTHAILGEDGPEAVIPLDNPDANVTPGLLSRYGQAAGRALSQVGGAALDAIKHSPSGKMISNAQSRYQSGHQGASMPPDAGHADAPMDGSGQHVAPPLPPGDPIPPPMAPWQPPANHGEPGGIKKMEGSADSADTGVGGDASDAGAEAADAVALARGGIITKPTNAIVGEHGREAVVPLSKPGIFSSHRYRPMTGPSMVHGPMHSMTPAGLDPLMKEKSGWKKWDLTHRK